jgi:hypothetical protein
MTMALSKAEMTMLEIAGLREGLEIERERVRLLRGGLEAAHEWLSGWASAEPYIGRIASILAETADSSEQPSAPHK